MALISTTRGSVATDLIAVAAQSVIAPALGVTPCFVEEQPLAVAVWTDL